jgi:hypothetical protein
MANLGQPNYGIKHQRYTGTLKGDDNPAILCADAVAF